MASGLKRIFVTWPVAWKEYGVEYWLKEHWESMVRCTGHCNITEILLKMVLNSIQSISNCHIVLQILHG